MIRARRLVGAVLLLGAGCGADSAADGAGPGQVACEPLSTASDVGPAVRGRVDEDGHFFARPFPDDSRLRSDGTLDLDGFPNPGNAGTLDDYVDAIQRSTRGWGLNSAIYLPLTGAIQPDTLPPADDPLATVAPSARVYLQDVGPESPEQGRRIPVQLTWYGEETEFLPANVLVVDPVLGEPLRDATTYVAVVTTAVRDRACRPLAAQGGDKLAGTGIDPATVAASARFTTMAVIEPMVKLREAVHALPEPVVTGLTHVPDMSNGDYNVYTGFVRVPIFQQGDPPYRTAGGEIAFDDAGFPIQVRDEDVRIALSFPKGGMPRSGWPLVLYSHGTGGNYLGYIRNGSAAELARRKLAGLGFDNVLHGPRDPTGSDANLNFVNLQNIIASRDNMRQGGVDGFALARLARAGISLRRDETADGLPALTDPQRVLFLGHSQGATTGCPFVAVEPDLLGAVFSGVGGVLRVTLLDRKFVSADTPLDFHELVLRLLRLDEPMSLTHPVPNLIQMFIEPAEPNNFARYFFLEDGPKPWPTDVLILQGLLDKAVPARSSSAFIGASGADFAEPVVRPVPAMVLRGQEPLPRPVQDNVAGVTGVAMQYPDDGHFALFDNADASHAAFRFLETAADGRAEVPR